jgi:hypothetical protein
VEQYPRCHSGQSPLHNQERLTNACNHRACMFISFCTHSWPKILRRRQLALYVDQSGRASYPEGLCECHRSLPSPTAYCLHHSLGLKPAMIKVWATMLASRAGTGYMGEQMRPRCLRYYHNGFRCLSRPRVFGPCLSATLSA